MSGPPTDVEQEVLRALREIRFGSLEITIHDGRVVQIERREKLRPQPAGREPSAVDRASTPTSPDRVSR